MSEDCLTVVLLSEEEKSASSSTLSNLVSHFTHSPWTQAEKEMFKNQFKAFEKKCSRYNIPSKSSEACRHFSYTKCGKIINEEVYQERGEELQVVPFTKGRQIDGWIFVA